MIALQPLDHLLATYGYAAVTVLLMLESLGIPLPGEGLMIAAAVFAAATHQLNIGLLILAAAAGAIAGDQIGYAIGRWVGFRVLRRWGRRIGISDARLELGRYLFRRYGGRIVFLGRFVAFMRTFVALLAGANRMPWHSFLLWNGLGGVCWTALYGIGAYALGEAARKVSGPLGIALGIAGAAALIASFAFVKRNETRLMAEAHKEMQAAHGRAA